MAIKTNDIIELIYHQNKGKKSIKTMLVKNKNAYSQTYGRANKKRERYSIEKYAIDMTNKIVLVNRKGVTIFV